MVARYAALEAVLDELVVSYRTTAEINNLESAALPSRRAVIHAFDQLQHVLFMGFFSTHRLEEGNLRIALAEHLLPCFDNFVDQIQRAVTYADRALPAEAQRPADWSVGVVNALMRRLPGLREVLEGDVQAAWANDPAAESVEEVIFSYPAITALTAHRVAHALFEARVPLIPRILSEHAHTLTGIDIHPGARIGRRFFIDHGTGVVIGATTDIGDDVKLYQGVTLGAASVRREPDAAGNARKRHPTLGDEVTVYAGATILGGDTVVGRGSIIGGNVWLTHSVPPYSKILRHAETPET